MRSFDLDPDTMFSQHVTCLYHYHYSLKLEVILIAAAMGLASFLSLLRRLKHNQDLTDLPNLALKLTDLPPELILSIVEHLSLESVAALSSTSKSFQHTLSSQTQCLSGNPAARSRFLRLLRMDLPTYFYCTNCNDIYEWEEVEQGFTNYCRQ